jgi:hypothetical protein
MKLKPWTIYLWRNGDKMAGASSVVTKDGIKEIFCHGWEIEKDPNAKRNKEIHQVFRAKTKVKNLLNNTLNVLNWYGKKVLDNKRMIDTEKLRNLEAVSAIQAIKNKKDISDIYPIISFPVEEITLNQANEFNLV